MELCPMLDVLNPFILWPIGVALGGLLFFEIAKRSLRVDPAPVASRRDQNPRLLPGAKFDAVGIWRESSGRRKTARSNGIEFDFGPRS